MQEGAFALIDCLGFKGIWNDEKAHLVLRKFAQIEKDCKLVTSKASSGMEELQILIKPKIILLSDTVAISIPPVKTSNEKKITDESKSACIEMIIVLVNKILNLFIQSEPHLTLRGCITYGKHSMRKNFMVGPAVDEAAEHYEIANGAFVWLLPKANERYEQLVSMKNDKLTELIEKGKQLKSEQELNFYKKIFTLAYANLNIPTVIKDFEMPFKNGQSLRSTLINPLILFEKEEERQRVIDLYAKSFNSVKNKNKIDVLIKKQNTMNFLVEANSQCKNFYGDNFSFDAIAETLNIFKK